MDMKRPRRGEVEEKASRVKVPALLSHDNRAAAAPFDGNGSEMPLRAHGEGTACDAQSDALAQVERGSSVRLQPHEEAGARILGPGGDGSRGGTGTFFVGALTSADPPDASDDAAQQNVVSVG
jgi:hypothetical protein